MVLDEFPSTRTSAAAGVEYQPNHHERLPMLVREKSGLGVALFLWQNPIQPAKSRCRNARCAKKTRTRE